MHGEVDLDKRAYILCFPLVPGGSAIARIDAVGPDAVALEPGQFAFCDVTVRARDIRDESILFGMHGGFSESSRGLMKGELRDVTWAEYAKFALENFTLWMRTCYVRNLITGLKW